MSDPVPPGLAATDPSASQRKQVEAMAGYGIPEAAIARVMRVDAPTLRKLYANELAEGQIKANTKVAENLYRKATGEGREAVIAAIFWLKTRAGWKETVAHELSGPDGGAIQTAETSSHDMAKALLMILTRCDTEPEAAEVEQ
jgi:hypothetical protein